MNFTTVISLGPQGRIVLPSKVRKLMNLEQGALLTLSYDGMSIHLKPCTAYASYFEKTEAILGILTSNVRCGVILCDRKKFLHARNIHVTKEADISEAVLPLFGAAKEQTDLKNASIYPTSSCPYPIHSFFPIEVQAGPGNMLALLLCETRNHEITQQEIGSARITAAMIKNYLTR